MLLGGAGSDSYQFLFDGTNGVDTISDSDGGLIVIDGKVLFGTAMSTSVSGQYTLNVSGTTFVLNQLGNDLEITLSRNL